MEGGGASRRPTYVAQIDAAALVPISDACAGPENRRAARP